MPSGIPSVLAISGTLEVEVVAEHDDRPLIGRQSSEDQIEQVAVRGHGRDVVDRRPVGRDQFDLDRPAATTAQDIDA